MPDHAMAVFHCQMLRGGAARHVRKDGKTRWNDIGKPRNKWQHNAKN